MDNFIIIRGARIQVPFECRNWVNDPTGVKLHTKVNARKRACRLITTHTVHGRTCKRLRAGGKPSNRDLTWARSHFNSERKASTDAYVDTDGSVVWANDPALAYTWGAGAVNPYAMHIELVTDEDGTLYEDTLRSYGELVVASARGLGIQLQTPWDPATGSPYAGRLIDCDPEREGRNTVGVIGHRNVWTHPTIIDPATKKPKRDASGKILKDHTRYIPQRGFGDPNDLPFIWLVEKHGVERQTFHLGAGQTEPEVARVWKERQKRLGIDADGLPLAGTVAALKAAGYPDGIWALRAA